MDPATLHKELVDRYRHVAQEVIAGEELSPHDKTRIFSVLHQTAALLGTTVTTYSGRCMNSRLCAGIVLANLDDFAFALAQACVSSQENPMEIKELLGKAASDSMGKQMILYWPRFETVYIPSED